MHTTAPYLNSLVMRGRAREESCRGSAVGGGPYYPCARARAYAGMRESEPTLSGLCEGRREPT